MPNPGEGGGDQGSQPRCKSRRVEKRSRGQGYERSDARVCSCNSNHPRQSRGLADGSRQGREKTRSVCEETAVGECGSGDGSKGGENNRLKPRGRRNGRRALWALGEARATAAPPNQSGHALCSAGLGSGRRQASGTPSSQVSRYTVRRRSADRSPQHGGQSCRPTPAEETCGIPQYGKSRVTTLPYTPATW